MAAYRETADVRAYETVGQASASVPAYLEIPAASMEDPVEAVAASVDTTKSQIHPTFTTSKQLKEEEKKEEEAKKENGVQKLKSSLLVTGVVVAVIGAIFAVVKNIKKAK
ncbi:unnamed protein product [Fraxinus pennsylvanica]|uniref:Uncharacterized protein n=1 Tax=Fraxinus pennsylvanica TaxID=56036 RepID=A0AAD2DYK9_9LAMI|nr:unnamed protein product [Fraxinus pennsylvanica]